MGFFGNSGDGANSGVRVLKKGHAARVIFFYPGEEGTYIDHAQVTLYENGIIHIKAQHEETTTHLQNCEILWQFEAEHSTDDRASKVRLLRPKDGPKDKDARSKDKTPPENSPRT